MRSDADCWNCKKYIFVFLCIAVFNGFVTSPAFAFSDGTNCYSLVVESSRVYSIPSSNTYSPMSEEQAREYCHDNASGTSYISRGVVVASSAWPTTSNWSDVPLSQTYSFSDISSQLGCYASYRSDSSESQGGFDFASLGAAIAPFLPQSPEQFRLPTIISNMTGQGTLAANLAIELFSAIWQYVALLLAFKFIKFLRG